MPENRMTENLENVDFSLEDLGIDDIQNDLASDIDDSSFTSGVKSGVETLKAMGHGSQALVGDLINNQELVQSGLQSYQDDMESAATFQQNAPITDFSEIEGLSDVGSFIAFHTGSALPTLAPAIASGGIGAVAGKALAKESIKELAEREITKKVAEGMTEKAAAKRVAAELAEQNTKSLAKGASVGAGVAAYGTSTGMNAGLNMGNIYEETGEVRSDVAMSAGAISGALDALPVMGVLKRMGVGKVAQQEIERSASKLLKDTGSGALSTGLQEGTTEALQTIVEQSAVQFVDDNQEMFSDYDWHEIQNAFFAGMAGGAPMGAAGGIASNTFATDAQSQATEPESNDSPEQTPGIDDNETAAANDSELGDLQTGSESTGAQPLSFRQLSQQAKEAKVAETRSEVESINESLTAALADYETAHATQGDTQAAMDQVKSLRKQLRQAKNKLDMAEKGRISVIDVIKQARNGKPGSQAPFNSLDESATDPVLGDLSGIELSGVDPIEAVNTGTTEYKKPEAKQPDFENGGIGLNAIPSWAERNAIEGELMPLDGLPAPVQPGAIGFNPLPGIEARNDIQVPPVDDSQRRMNTGLDSQHPEPGFNPVTPGSPQGINPESLALPEPPIYVQPENESQLHTPKPDGFTQQVPEYEAPAGQELTQEQSLTITRQNLRRLKRLNDQAKELASAGSKEARPRSFVTPRNNRINAVYAVMPLDKLKASHDIKGNSNPDYDQNLQPRARENTTSEEHIRSVIINNFIPEKIADHNIMTDTGAPFINAAGHTLSGNGRMIALKELASNPKYKDKWQAYQRAVKHSAKEMGLELGSVKNPVLVRIKQDDSMSDVRFAEESNENDKAKMSRAEQAAVDARNITADMMESWNPGESGNALADSNKGFLSKYREVIGESEAAGLTDSKGRFTEEAAKRIESAIFHKAYQNKGLTNSLVEAESQHLVRLMKALTKAAPSFAKARSAAQEANFEDYDAVETVVSAVELVIDAKNRKQSINELVAQKDAFDQPEESVTMLAKGIGANMQSAPKLGLMLEHFAEYYQRLVEQQSNASLFGDEEALNLNSLYDAVNQEMRKEYGESFTAIKSETRSDNSRTNEPGNRQSEQGNAEGTGSNQTEGNTEELLTSYSEKDLEQREAQAKAKEEQQRKEQEALEQKAQADAEAKEFSLSGSTAPADVAASKGQNDLFVSGSSKPKEPKAQVFSTSELEDQIVSQLNQGKARDQQDVDTAVDSFFQGMKSNKFYSSLPSYKTRKDDIESYKAQRNEWGEISLDRIKQRLGERELSNKSDYGKKNKLFTEDSADKARQLLRSKLGQLNSGLDPELMQAGITLAGYHVEAGARKFADFAKAMVNDLGENVRPYLRSFYESLRYYPGLDTQGMSDANEIDQYEQGLNNAEYSTTDTQPDSRADEKSNLEGDLFNEVGGRSGSSTNQTGEETSEVARKPGTTVDNRSDSATGKRGDSPFSAKQSRVEPSIAGSIDDSGSLADSTGGLFADRDTAKSVEQVTSNAPSVSPKASFTPGESITPADLDQISKQMPFLTEGQKADVVFAEKRLSQPEGYGVMFTNGTGTGKTFTGLGVAARSVAKGKGNILVAVPKQTIADGWEKAGRNFFNLDISRLKDKGDKGQGVVVTTYANLGDNDSVIERDWDMVILDESHYLSSDQQGNTTKALSKLRAMTLQNGSARARVYSLNPDLVSELSELRTKLEAARSSDDERVKAKEEQYQDRIKVIIKALDEKTSKENERIQAVKPKDKPRALMLSATPFAYEKSVKLGQGFLFDWGSDKNGLAYNSGGNYEQFMMTHFGYRMRYNKLTEPEGKVNRGLMQRSFNAWLKKEGVLSGRALDSDFDYDRKFVITESAIGRRVDDAIDWLWEHASGENAIEGVSELREKIMGDSFDYHKRMYFLEAMKAREVLPIIEQHLALGRKVLVMHDFKKGGTVNPFRVAVDDKTRGAYQAFKAEFSDLINSFSTIESPVDLLSSAYPDALVYNGDYSAKKRVVMQDRFNEDTPQSPNLMIAQGDAMREGVSIHDTTGQRQRVLIHLGMPVKPTAAIQQEGRIYRTGQASDALFRYVTIGTNWERHAFASKIAQRASTAENLAMGEQARGLKESFIQAYEEAADYPAGHDGEGKGGKELDQSYASILTPWDGAKSDYYGTKKQGSGRAARGRENSEFFATPEPLGFKMVQWADIQGGESVLEPSAGHGAIGRYFPENTKNRAIEFTTELSSKLALRFPGNVVTGAFEDHNIINKYDAIVMNPPFGHGGKTAADHVRKAMKHLKDNGRIVALIPSGGMADKRFNELLYSEDAANIYLRASIDLPRVTFERAGTSISTKVIVLEKQLNDEYAAQVQQTNRDYSNAETIEEFFERLEHSEIPERVRPPEEEEPASVTISEVSEQAPDAGEYKVWDDKDTRDQSPIYLMTAQKKLDADEYKALRSEVKKHNGFWSRYKKAFLFKQESDRQAFLDANSKQAAHFSRGQGETGKINQSRTISEISDKGMSVEKLETVIMPELQTYIHAPPVRFVQHQRDLPSWLLEQNEAETGGRGRIKAVLDPNTNMVYMVADNIGSREEARQKLEHELRGHFGMEALLGDDFGKLIRQVELFHKSGNPYVKTVIPIVERNYPKADRLTFYSEVIAHLAEDHGKGSKLSRAVRDMWVRLKAAVRRWRKEKLGLQTPFSETELKNLLIQAGRLLQSGSPDPTNPGNGRKRQALFSRDAAPANDSTEAFNVGAYNWKDDLVRKVQDKLQPLKKVQNAIGGVPGYSDAYREETLMHGKLEKKLEDFDKEYIEPITNLMSEENITLPELDLFLYARHAQERNEYIASINPDAPDGGSGMTNAEAQRILQVAAESDNARALDRLADLVDRMAAMRVELLRDSGLEQSEILDAWDKYDHYVPLKGWAEGEDGKTIEPIIKRGQGFDVRGKESMRALGRRTLAASPLTNLIGDVEATIQRVEKNSVGQAFLNMVRDNPNEDYWQVFSADDLGVTRRIKQVRGDDGVMHDQVVYDTDRSPLFDRRNFLSVKEDGKEYFIKLEDERLMIAMKNLGTDQLNPLMQAMSKATRFLASMVTSYNPEFVISNMARDIQTAVYNLVAEADIEGGRLDGNKIASKVVKDVPKSVKGIWRALREKSENGNEYQQLWEQFKADGAKIGFYSLQDFEHQQKRIQSKINRAGKGWKTWLTDKGEGLIDYISHANAAIENGVRLAAYKHAIDSGVERAQAAELAKNLTVNFNRRGELGTFVNSFYMFFNAAIQGTAQLVRVMQSKKAQKAMAGMVAFGGVLAVFNSMFAGEDEDGENLYAKLPDYIKERNLVLLNPFADGKENRFITIPLPYGYNVFHVAGVAVGELLTGDRSLVEAASMISLTALGAFNPIGTGQSEEFDKALIKTLTPTLASPIAELSMNENFFGSTIYRENFPTGTPRPDSHLAKSSTGTPYKVLAQALNEWSGGSDYRSGAIDIHPETFSHFVNFTFGGLGALINRSTELAFKLSEGQDFESREVPFVRKLFNQPSGYQNLQSFYDRSAQISQYYKEYQSLNGTEKTRFGREHKGLIGMYSAARNLNKRLKQLREELNRLEASSMSDALKDARRKLLEREQEKLVNAFNKRFSKTVN